MSASTFRKVFLEEISFKITLVQGRKHPRQEHPSVASSLSFLSSIPTSKLDNKLFDWSAEPLKIKSLIAIAPIGATNVPKYSKDDLQRILKAVLEAQALVLTPTPVLASVISEVA